MTVSPLVTSSAVLTPAADSGRTSIPSQTDPPPANSEAGGAQPRETPSPGQDAATRSDQQERASSPDGLTARERRIVVELQRIDRQVRAHEQAHLAAAGGLARGVSFQFTTGPDGRRYAVGGEVGIDTSTVEGNPEATIRKAQQIRAAATAPANPSPQDRAVAAQASAMEAQARQELFAERREALEQQIRSSQSNSFGENNGVELGTILDALA